MGLKSGYKKTEVGVIPEDWETATIGETCGVRVGRDLIAERFATESDHNFRFPIYSNTVADEGLYGFYSFPEYEGESVTVVGRGVGLGTAFARSGGYGAIGRLLVLLPNHRIDARFLATYINQRVTIFTETGGIPQLTGIQFSKYRIAVPETSEQRAIAEALSDVEELLGGLDRLIAKKRDLKQAAMQQLLTGQARLPGFHGDWQQGVVEDVILGYFCGPSPTCDERNIEADSEWGVLKTTAATKEAGWNWRAHKALPPAFWNKPHLEIKRGDVIVTKAGPRHRVGVTAWVDFVPPRIIVSGKMIGLRPNPAKIVPMILASAISAPKAQVFLDQRTTGMAESQVNFENGALMQTPIHFPKIDEQTAIAEVLTEMDAELAALEQRREKTCALKQAMMQELLTGKTRLV